MSFARGLGQGVNAALSVYNTMQRSEQLQRENDRQDKQWAREDKQRDMLDKANDKYGHRVLTMASSGVGRKPWHMRQERKSPRYTTCWAELPLVK